MGVDTHHNAGTTSEGGGDATKMHEQPDLSRDSTTAASQTPAQRHAADSRSDRPMKRSATQQHSNTATQQHSNTATQQHSNTATHNTATRQRGNAATRQRGNAATRQRGNAATRQRTVTTAHYRSRKSKNNIHTDIRTHSAADTHTTTLHTQRTRQHDNGGAALHTRP
jgi:hypothetical protein